MKQAIRKVVASAATLLLLLSVLSGCQTQQQTQEELESAVHDAIYGAWVYYDEAQNARYCYLIDNGIIEQSLVLTDDDGIEHDLSLGDSFSIRYRVVAEDEIAIYSTLGGTATETQTIHFEKVDDNTLILDGVTYTRYEAWVKTQ